MRTIKITGINKTYITLNKSMVIICNDGMKRRVSHFCVKEISKTGKSVEVWFYYGVICMTSLMKRITFENGNLFIKVGNSLYNIGDYEEV